LFFAARGKEFAAARKSSHHATKRRDVSIIDDENRPGTRRFYAQDPRGNHPEFVEIGA
jgi:hypothetical protein